MTQKRALLAKRSLGEVGLLEIAESIEHYVKQGDWTRFGTLMEVMDPKDCGVIREICERCLIGARFVPSQKFPSGWRLKRSSGMELKITPALKTCKKLEADGHSFRSRVVANMFSLTWIYDDNWDLDQAMKRIISRAEDAGKSQAVLDELSTCRKGCFDLMSRAVNTSYLTSQKL